MDTKKYLTELRNELLTESNWKPLQLKREWTCTIPKEAGVYVLKQDNNLVYVGETGNLCERIKDLFDSRQHSVRRTIGQRFYSKEEGYIPASTKKKFPEHIETLVMKHLTTFSIAYMPVPVGRKELEELIQEEILQETKLNQRGKRKS